MEKHGNNYKTKMEQNMEKKTMEKDGNNYGPQMEKLWKKIAITMEKIWMETTMVKKRKTQKK